MICDDGTLYVQYHGVTRTERSLIAVVLNLIPFPNVLSGGDPSGKFLLTDSGRLVLASPLDVDVALPVTPYHLQWDVLDR